MSNEVRARRLLVTLPDVSGDEADGTAETIERATRRGGYPDATVEHLLDDAPLEGYRVRRFGRVFTISDEADDAVAIASPDDARKLAALLLRAADEAEGV